MQGRRRYLKLIGFWVGFLILHYAYDFFPMLPIKLISGVDESFFQHAKIAFFAYGIVSSIEWAVWRKQVRNLEPFVFSRLFATTVLPWFIFIVWFSAAAYYGRMPNVVAEIVFANVVLALAGACALIVEQAMEGVTYSKALKVVIAALFIVSLSLYVIFTFKLPWADVFAEPGG